MNWFNKQPMESIKVVKVQNLFKKDAQGLVIPELASDDMQWVISVQKMPGQCFQTIKVDGITVKVRWKEGQKNLWRRTKVDDQSIWFLCRRDCVEDAPLWEAYDNYKNGKADEGTYVAYGPQIKGNPQNADCHLMVKVDPVEHSIIMYNGSGIVRGGTVQDLYDSLKKELAESDCEGVVFQYEYPSMKLNAAAQVTRKDFGYEWPLKPSTLPQEALSQAPSTSPISEQQKLLPRGGNGSYVSMACTGPNAFHNSCTVYPCNCDCHLGEAY